MVLGSRKEGAPSLGIGFEISKLVINRASEKIIEIQ